MLPKNLWVEAINTSTYLLNRLPSFTIQNYTPFEIWTGRKPDFSNVRVFGSVVHYHIPKENREKLDKKSNKGYLVGYAPTGYRIWNDDIKKVIISRDTVINEDLLYKDEVEIGKKISVHRYEDIENVIISESENDTEDEIVEDETVSDFYAFNCIPTTYKDIQNMEDKDKWTQAVERELNSLKNADTWEFAKLPPSKSPVSTRWIFRKKTDPKSGDDLHKARLVARGYAQKPNIDYNEIYTPVLKMQTFRTDVETAFVNGFIDKEIYLRLPDGLRVSTENTGKVLRLKKSL